MDRSSTRRHALPRHALAALAVCGAPAASAAGIDYLDAFRNQLYTQTGSGNSLTFSSAFYSADLNSVTPNAYNAVLLIYPGPGSPVSVPELSPPSTDYRYQTPSLPTKAAMDAAFPTGTYFFATDKPDTASFVYSADDYPQSHPYLVGSDYSKLQGMDPADPFTFHFNHFDTGSMANASFTFLTIYDNTLNAFVFNAGFLPSTTTSVTVPANTLQFGDAFSYEIDFSNRDFVAGTGANSPPQLGFDVRTDGIFKTAAAPEFDPASACSAITLLLGLLAVSRGRQAKQDPVGARLSSGSPHDYTQ